MPLGGHLWKRSAKPSRIGIDAAVKKTSLEKGAFRLPETDSFFRDERRLVGAVTKSPPDENRPRPDQRANLIG